MTKCEKTAQDLSKCSKCGACQAVCPTYLLTGREPMSARARNAVLKGFIEGSLSASEIEDAVFSCLLCRACIPACFSGVDTSRLMLEGREMIVSSSTRRLSSRILGDLIYRHPSLLAAALRSASFLSASGVFRLFKKAGLLTEDAHSLLKMTEFASKSFFRSDFKPPAGVLHNTGGRIAYFPGCGVQYLYPETGYHTLDIMKRRGYDVAIPSRLCCGLPALSKGYRDISLKLARKNILALEHFDKIVTDCGSCSSFLKEYVYLLEDDKNFRYKAEIFSEKVLDINEFIYAEDKLQGRISPPTQGWSLTNTRSEKPLKITYHDPCHLSRYQNITKEPREIIKSIPNTEYIEMKEADWCCGGSVFYGVSGKELSDGMLRRKVENIKASGVDIIATSCPMCMMRISHGLRSANIDIKVAHVTELYT